MSNIEICRAGAGVAVLDCSVEQLEDIRKTVNTSSAGKEFYFFILDHLTLSYSFCVLAIYLACHSNSFHIPDMSFSVVLLVFVLFLCIVVCFVSVIIIASLLSVLFPFFFLPSVFLVPREKELPLYIDSPLK